MLSGARIATLVCFFLIGAIALFAIVDRVRAGQPAVSLVMAGGTSVPQFFVTAAADGSPLHRGDRVTIDDRAELAAYQLRALAVGARLHVRRVAPPPAAMLEIPVVAKARPNYAAAAYLLEPLFLGIAALIAARGRSNGSLSLAWLFALIVLLFNPTTPAWPAWLILAYATSGGIIAIGAFFCATDFATRFTGDPDAHWARRYRVVSWSLASAAVALSIWWSRRFRPPGQAARDGYIVEDSQDLREAVESGRSALRTLDDARAAIIACYVAMETHLAERGTARAVADTPDELLARAQATGLVRGTAAARLTALFYEARFSSHPLDRGDWDAAADALDELAAALTQSAPAPAEAGDKT